MKNLRKALAAVLALTVMSVSATAFAEVSFNKENNAVNNAVGYTFADNTVTATVTIADATPGTQMTFLILDDGTNVTNIGEADILYIDQKELANGNGGNSFTGVINLARVNGGVGAAELPEGSYPIRLGYTDVNGDFAVAVATMVVSAGGGTTTVTLLWGDLNGDGNVLSSDAVEIVFTSLGYERNVTVKDVEGTAIDTVAVGGIVDGLNLRWGDLNGDGNVLSSDAVEIVFTSLGYERSVTVKDADGATIGTVAVGDTIDVPVE